MTGKKVNYEVTLKSSIKAVSSVVYTLKLPNFFRMSQYTGTPRSSPTFDFANATWSFRFHPNGRPVDLDRKYFDVSILRETSEVPRHKICYTVKLLNANGYCYDSFYNVDVFDKDNLEHGVGHFIERRSKENKPRIFKTTDILNLTCELFCIDSTTEVTAPNQVSLSSDRDVEILSQDFKKLFLNGKNQDLTLRVAGKEFRVHQDILMARSQVFEAMLTHDMTEKNEGVIEVPDCNPQAMEQLLFYVYSGKVEDLNQDNALGLYYAADKYQMIPLKEESAKFIKKSLSVSIICDVIQLALNHSDTDLLESATQYFVNHVSEIVSTVKWISLMKSNMIAANELFIKATKKWDCTKS